MDTVFLPFHCGMRVPLLALRNWSSHNICNRGHNTVQFVRGANSAAMNALIITSHYIPWKDSHSTAGENFISGETRALRLKVEYEHTDPKPGQTVKCYVETERIGFRGYGMMLAEIGLPPGSEVDRESLETARDGGSIQGYEVQPDRVVFMYGPRQADPSSNSGSVCATVWRR